MRRPQLLALLPLLAIALPAGAEKPLGRLFFTPERRLELDRERVRPSAEPSQAPMPATTLNGIVRRSSRVDTTWINGIPQPLSEVRAGDASSSAALPVGDAAPAAPPRQLKVGETFHPDSGLIVSPLHEGRVLIRAGATAAARP